MLRPLLAAGLIALAGAAAQGCKGNLLRDISEYPKTKAELEIEARPGLGVAVAKKAPPLALGVKLERVLRDGPADRAGLREGDESARSRARASARPGTSTTRSRAAATGRRSRSSSPARARSGSTGRR